MLERLIIENLALIERLDLDLSGGFTVLTGETGAGKSIIIDGLNFVLGGRGSRELISYDKQKCRVEAIFGIADMPEVIKLLDEMQLNSDDGDLTIMRELSVSGKGVCRVNGVIIPISSLKTITDLLVDIHGQHEHQSLLDDKNHLQVIDKYSEETILPLVDEVNGIYRDYSQVSSRLNAGFMSEAERERRIDVLKYQINEIEGAKLTPDDEDRIKEELNILTNAETIAKKLESASSCLNRDSGVVSLLRTASDELASIAEFSSAYGELSARLNNLYYELEDAAYSVRDLNYDFEYDPKRIDELETRLDVIDGLKHKYGRTVREVLDFAENARKELDELSGDSDLREKLTKQKKELSEKYFEAAARLTEARKASADTLCGLAEEQLKELGMKKARLSAEFLTAECQPRENGMDDVRLLLSANEGEPLKPLSKVASGGELSRIMLALKTVITDADGIPTLIFDEVDTGISGNTANTVGLRMKKISRKHQVLCVTHLPQIAAFADNHFVVSKQEKDGKTVTGVLRLKDMDRAKELARIMGADAGSEAAVMHAEELIKKASAYVV